MAPRPSRPRLTVSKQVKPSVSQSNRQRFLRRVRAFWIDGALEHSLHGTALIALGLQEQPDAVANPWHLVLQHPDATLHPLPARTRITQVYDAVNGELLILGAPGSGKTTLLLELARDLLDRAEHDEQHLMPVVFTLSSWARKQPLTEWLVEELISKYQVPRKLARTWVDADQILPLLDGLDEVAPEDRTACIDAINTYRQKHGLLPLVVASRSTDYLAQTAHVMLNSAVTVQPLTPEQVDDYLVSGGEALWALRVALHQDAALRELTETPLMLSILTLTYHDMPVEELLRGGIAPTRQQVFETYVNRMLTRRRIDPRFSVQQTIQWLTWLAGKMKQHNRTQFYIEQLQPTWLKDRRAYITYRCILVGLLELSIGSFSLLSGPFSLLFGLLAVPFSLLFRLPAGSFPILVIELLAGLLIGLFKRTIEIRPVEFINWSWRAMKRGLLIGLLVGLATGLFVGYTRWLLVYLSLGADIGNIWHQYINAPLPSWITHGLPIINGLINGLITSLLVGLVTALFRGPSGARIDEQNRFGPNQGIWRSARNGGIFALISLAINLLIYLALFSSSITTSAGFFVYAPLNSPPNSAELALPLLLTIWNFITGVVILVLPLIVLFMGLRMGGAAAIQHVVLRVLLWSSRSIPWNYPRFLDYAAEHILLRKVGGSYIFVHRLLLEYFASLDTTPTPDAARAKK